MEFHGYSSYDVKCLTKNRIDILCKLRCLYKFDIFQQKYSFRYGILQHKTDSYIKLLSAVKGNEILSRYI